MTTSPDISSLTAALTLVEQDVTDARTALSSASVVAWVSPSAALYQSALAAAALQLTSVDTALVNARASLANVVA